MRLTLLIASALLVTACGQEVNLDNDDDFQSYRDGYIWLSDWDGRQECNGALVDDWEDLTGDDYTTNADAFLLGCRDYLNGKMPRK